MRYLNRTSFHANRTSHAPASRGRGMAATRSGLLIGCIAIFAGCMTAQTYDGPRRPSGEVAHISGDYLVTAGAPITLIIRMIDGVELSMSQSAVEVLPGTHTLLVDCRIQETKSVTRHTLEVEVFAGQRYRLVADTGPALRECTAVRLEGSY